MESTMARPTSPTLLPDASGLHLVRLEADEQFILAVVETTSPEALCPLCQCRSQSIHSRYVRVVADLPWAGWAVRLKLHVRRFFCRNQECQGRPVRPAEEIYNVKRFRPKAFPSWA